MRCLHRSLDDHVARLRLPGGDPAMVIVDLDGGGPSDLPALRPGWREVVVGTTSHAEPLAHPGRAVCDVVVGRDDPLVDAIASTVSDRPIAASALAGLLRGSEGRGTDEGLLVESAVYSALQAGPELATWRQTYVAKAARAEGPPIELRRDDDVLTIALVRPHVRNALSTAMRDALVEALALPAVDPSIAEVHLVGAGPDFCSGGDLDEFGSFDDPASAHLVRLQQSVGRAVAAVADRVTAHLHGACVGSGIELPAFASRVVATADARISLPEVSLGLVPGAGGTVSLPRRIGRHRTALLALSGMVLDAATARAWGLVDELDG